MIKKIGLWILDLCDWLSEKGWLLYGLTSFACFLFMFFLPWKSMEGDGILVRLIYSLILGLVMGYPGMMVTLLLVGVLQALGTLIAYPKYAFDCFLGAIGVLFEILALLLFLYLLMGAVSDLFTGRYFYED